MITTRRKQTGLHQQRKETRRVRIHTTKDNLVVKHERSMLHRALATRDIDYAREIIVGTKDKDIRDERLRTPLHCAASGDVALVHLVLSNGATIDAQDCRGRTPLHYASISGKNDIVSLLLKNGANPDLVDDENVTPSEYARSQGFNTIVRLLSSVHGSTKQSGRRR